MDWNLSKGQTIIIELINEVFVGDVFYIDKKNKTRIELINVRNYQDNSQFSGVQIYYRSEIRSITLFKEIDDDKIKKDNKNDSAELLMSNLSLDTLNKIHEYAFDFKYIYQIDKNFYDFLTIVKNRKTIGISIVIHHSKLSLIAISTDTNIYLLDIVSFGNIPLEIKKIFEDNKCQKVIHNSRIIAQHLKFKQNIELCNVFDTLVAYWSLQKSNNTIISLEKCISTCLNLPSNCFVSRKDINWSLRPLEDDMKSIAVKSVTYLLVLRQHLETLIMKPFYDNVYMYMDSLRDCPIIFPHNFTKCEEITEKFKSQIDFNASTSGLIKNSENY